jgi:hypothetical protein
VVDDNDGTHQGKYDMVMNLAQAILHEGPLDDFVNERRAQMAKHKIRAAKNQNELTEQHLHDYAMFELAIRAFDVQSGWRDAFERQREYTRRTLFMEKLNPEKFSQRLEELNKYLDYIPIEKTTPKEWHMENRFQMMRLDPSWREPFHQNGQ